MANISLKYLCYIHFLPLEVLANQIELMEDASLCQEATKACKILENYYSELEEFEQLGDILKIR